MANHPFGRVVRFRAAPSDSTCVNKKSFRHIIAARFMVYLVRLRGLRYRSTAYHRGSDWKNCVDCELFESFHREMRDSKLWLLALSEIHWAIAALP